MDKVQRLPETRQFYALPVKTLSGAALGLALVCTLLILGTRLLSGGLPRGELLPLAVARDPYPPDIALLDPSRSLFYFLMRDHVWDNSPAVSPDGGRVVFTSCPNSAGGLWMIVLDTRERRMLLDGAVYYWLPSWSPDGSQIAFTASDTLVTEIYLLTLLDGSVRQLTDDIGIGMYATWSPDGGHLVYVASDGFDPAGLYVMPVECPEVNGVCGLVARQLTDQPGFDVSPSWSPDGSLIAFASDRGGTWDIYVMDAHCVDVENHLPCLPRVRPMTHEGYRTQIGPVSWSRDGRQLRFVVPENGWHVLYGLETGCEQKVTGCPLQRLARVQ